MRLLPACVAAVLLVPAVAWAQNKCVDAKGKVTYQQDPCPGTVRAPAPVPPPPPYTGPSSQQLWTEVGELERCADEWQSIARIPQKERMREYMQIMMERFLPICGKYGFQDPTSPAIEQKNSAIAQDLRRQRDAKRQQIDVAKAGEAPAPPAARGSLEQEAREMQDCADYWDQYARHSNKKDQQTRQSFMARFLPKCGKYGFEYPKDDAAEARNTAAALELRRKEGAARAQAKDAVEQERAADDRRVQAMRDARAEQERLRMRQHCPLYEREINQAKLEILNIPADRLEKYKKDLAETEQRVAKICN